MDVFLQRIRKYGQTMPDSVLPPPEIANANANPPRMSTPQPDSTWTGWAISSFTNKLAGANGEIQQKTDGSDRSASVPPSSNQTLPSGPVRPIPVIQQSAPTVPRVSSSLRNTPQVSDVENEDFGADWGEVDDETADAWGEVEESPKPTKITQASTAKFDDQGEPDFAGWLSAQAQANTKGKSVLPKGLAKSRPSAVTSKSNIVTSSTSARVVPSKVVASKPTAPAAKAKEAPPPKAQEDDDWGDAWG